MQTLPIPEPSIAANDDKSGDFFPAASSNHVSPNPPEHRPVPPPAEMIDLTEESDVLCPICSQTMKQSVINAHLDRCMRGDSSFIPSPSVSASSSTRTVGSSPLSLTLGRTRASLKDIPDKKPVKLVYDMLKHKDLQKILRVR
ncbi:hypothetical protein BX666DRAFT_913197 [Dichotomocladium elegans]|nr:hypothetical protein BX666DRAFT_913197 [Dichotomocladium elegans]